jgi:tetratricopeptide (TPR) repeat protein
VIKGQFDQAIADFNMVLKIDPKSVSAYYNRGVAYGGKGQNDQAIADFNRVLKINPKSAGSYYNRAIAYYLKKEYDKSWKDIKQAQDLGHNIPSEFLENLRNASGRQN